MPTATPSPHDRQARWRQPTNPFATRNVRPAVISYRFDRSDIDLERLALKFLSESAAASLIIGPHGTGKSTLLQLLIQRLASEFPAIESTVLRNDQPPRGCTRWALRQPVGTLLIVDGMEQLSPLRRLIFRLACRLRKQRCLATAHAALPGFRELYRTAATIELAKRLASELLVAEPTRIAPANDFIDQIWDDLDGNLRDLWFAMYDWYQSNTTMPR